MSTRTYGVFVALCAASLVSIGLNGCGREGGTHDLARQLTHMRKYRPPESACTDSARAYPTMYARPADDTLKGTINPDPRTPLENVEELGPRDLARRLYYVRQAMQEQWADTGEVPEDINLVLDRSMDYQRVMFAIYVAGTGTFGKPHLITASGRSHDVEPPLINPRFGPMWWSGWIWWMPDQSFRWAAWPDSGENVRFHKVPAKDGKPDIAALMDSMRTTLDSLHHIPQAHQRLIGIWAYDELPYPELVRLMDTVRFPKDGQPLGGRITLLQGRIWAPPRGAM